MASSLLSARQDSKKNNNEEVKNETISPTGDPKSKLSPSEKEELKLEQLKLKLTEKLRICQFNMKPNSKKQDKSKQEQYASTLA